MGCCYDEGDDDAATGGGGGDDDDVEFLCGLHLKSYCCYQLRLCVSSIERRAWLFRPSKQQRLLQLGWFH